MKVYKVTGFKKLEENEQYKELFFLYGVCISRFSVLEHFFLHNLRHNKYIFEGKEIRKKWSEAETQKFEKHLEDVATLKMLVNEFRNKFITDKHDALFDELVTIRNLLVHKYMKYNWIQFSEKNLREEIYDDLMYAFEFLNKFDISVTGVWFFTKKNPDFGVRFKGSS
jgi:hypothetical protein